MILNEKQIEQAGKEEYALWRKTKDRVNSIKEFMVANATSHIDRLDKISAAAKEGNMRPMTEMMLEGIGGGVAGVIKGTAKALKNRASAYNRSHTKWNGPKKKGPKPDYTPKRKERQASQETFQNSAGSVVDGIKFAKHINVIEYFKPVQTKAQMAAAINKLKHEFSNYDTQIRGIGKNTYNAVQESIYGGLEKGLRGSKMDQHGQWARELYVEKMRGLGVL